MPRKKVVPEENPEQVKDTEMEAQSQEAGLEQPPADAPREETSPPAAGEEAPQPDPPPQDTDTPPAEPPAKSLDTGQDRKADAPPDQPSPEGPVDVPEEASAMKPFWMEPSAPPTPPPEPEPSIPQKSDRQSFYDLDFNALDRDLTAEERQEWNSIYASYRGRSALTGTIIGVDPHIIVRNKETGAMEKKTMYCAIVAPYRVRVVIPDTEMWGQEQARPDFVLQNMGGCHRLHHHQSGQRKRCRCGLPASGRPVAGKYGGGVFCNLPDGTVCMCNYSCQHEDSDFMVGDTVIIVVQRFETEKWQMYGKIMSKW